MSRSIGDCDSGAARTDRRCEKEEARDRLGERGGERRREATRLALRYHLRYVIILIVAYHRLAEQRSTSECTRGATSETPCGMKRTASATRCTAPLEHTAPGCICYSILLHRSLESRLPTIPTQQLVKHQTRSVTLTSISSTHPFPPILRLRETKRKHIGLAALRLAVFNAGSLWQAKLVITPHNDMDKFGILRKRKIFVILFGEPIQHHGIRILLLQITLYGLKQSLSPYYPPSRTLQKSNLLCACDKTSSDFNPLSLITAV